MRPDTFFTYKKALGDSMRSTLTHSIAVGRPLKPYCATEIQHVIAIQHETSYFGDNEGNGDTRETIEDVHDFMHRYPTAELTMESMTKQPYCSIVAYGTRFKFTRPAIIGEIEDYMIDEEMKKWVRAKLFLKEHEALECRVMELFKKGIINWDEVKEAHKGTCSL